MVHRKIVAIDEADHAWLTETAKKLNVSIVEIIRAMVGKQKMGGLTDLDRIKTHQALQRLRAQKEKIEAQEKALEMALAEEQPKRRQRAVPVYDGDTSVTKSTTGRIKTQ